MAAHLCAQLENQAHASETTYYTFNVPSNATHRQSPDQIGVTHFWKFSMSYKFYRIPY